MAMLVVKITIACCMHVEMHVSMSLLLHAKARIASSLMQAKMS